MRIVPIDPITLTCFDLNIDLAVPLCEFEDFTQRRNLLRFRPAARKVSCRIQFAQYGKVQIQDIPLTIRHPFNRIVMKHNGMAIATHMDIKLNRIDWQCKGIAKSCKSIFGSQARPPAMSNLLKMLHHKRQIVPSSSILISLLHTVHTTSSFHSERRTM